ncbi:hypothetical protein AWW66_16995 [Micromonospora rosaria]|uniref:Uncharacterized protein n=1 Tax=Micromonospora rosaria TaxID=47874 RepID=A0A136PQW8_9ACTN|nr:hypothetical protein [Micromonospora rosaria]KXK60823.1 hypothetical protein AWW66_16995 [Micromonospora rosaria]
MVDQVLASDPPPGQGAAPPADRPLTDRPPGVPGVGRRVVGVLRRVAAAGLWAAVLAGLVYAWRWTDTPTDDIRAYLVYWLAGLVLPGTLVHRALRGSRGNLPEDLGYGAAVGLVLELAAWALATATGAQSALRWWPVPVVLLFLVVPRLWRHWRVREPRPLPLRWHLAMAVLLGLIICWAAAQWEDLPLPPADFAYYQDLMYHLGLVQELTRGMPFELPQVAGEALRYHYLSDAHMASASLVTGSHPATVLLRLWLVPVAATAAVVTAGLARDLAGRWWVGPVGAAAAYLGVPLTLGSPVSAGGGLALSFASPSQTYMLPLLMLLTGLCVDLVRGRGLGPAWVLPPVLALACTGAKSSALPPLIAGLGLAGLVAWVRARRFPWRVLLALATLLAAMAAGYRLFAGGGAGVLVLQFFGLIRHMDPYRETLGVDDPIEIGGLLPPGVAAADGSTGWHVALGILGFWLVLQLPRLAGLLVTVSRGGRGDPAAWLLGGAVVAGTTACWTLFHPSASQLYFFAAVMPFGAVLTGWLLAVARPPWPVLLTAAAGGAAAQLLVPPLAEPAETVPAWQSAMADTAWRVLALVGAAALLAVLLTVLFGGRAVAGSAPDRPARGRGRWVAVANAGVAAALVGASVAEGVDLTVQWIVDEPRPPAAAERLVTADEMRAALWLDGRAGADDVVATNVHCQPVRTYENCDARAFWVTGLGGRRALLESWGYSDAVVAEHGRDGRSYPLQPAPDPEVYALNQRVFTAPAAGDLARLRHEYGVRWLFADTRAGKVSPALSRLAPIRFTAGPVTIHELP